MASNGNGKKSTAQLNQEIDEVLRMRQRRAASTSRSARGSSSSGIPSQAAYEHQELAEAHKRLGEIQRAPLADRREAQSRFLEVMRGAPEVVAERIGWLVDGNYGYGPMTLAKRVLASPRMNRPAALTHMIGAFEWQSPEIMSRGAWKRLTPGEKTRLESAVQGAITSALRGE